MKKVVKANKQYVKANWENYFWNLHSKDMETGLALEDIIEDMGLSDLFFPEDGEPEAGELEYKTVIDAYGAQPSASININKILEQLVECAKGLDGVASCYLENDIAAIRITTDGKKRYQLVLQKLN